MTTDPSERKARRRLDQALVENGYFQTRAQAQAAIQAGQVHLAGAPMLKPAATVLSDAVIEVHGAAHDYVSRGGLKLAHALTHFGLSPEGREAVDLGASTGGFTDVLLRHGAAHCLAVDVGQEQLVADLRDHPKVTVLEKTNARHLTRAALPDGYRPMVIVCDVSFISLKLALPPMLALAAPACWLVALVKPQFEVGKKRLGKGGVVRDAALHDAVCADMQDWLAGQSGWQVLGLTDSPVLGPSGNREFLLAAVKS